MSALRPEVREALKSSLRDARLLERRRSLPSAMVMRDMLAWAGLKAGLTRRADRAVVVTIPDDGRSCENFGVTVCGILGLRLVATWRRNGQVGCRLRSISDRLERGDH